MPLIILIIIRTFKPFRKTWDMKTLGQLIGITVSYQMMMLEMLFSKER